MRAYEFKSVIEARRQVEDKFTFFRKMMLEKEMGRNGGQLNDTTDGTEKLPTIRGCDFKSVIEVRQQVAADLEWFREMLDAKDAIRNGRPVSIPISRDMHLLNRIWPCWENLPDY